MARNIAVIGVHVQCFTNYHNMAISKTIQIGIRKKAISEKLPMQN